jgi:small subunit ribosomal protein S1
VRVDDGIEGLINKANLSESKEETFEEAVKKYHEGDKITVFVVDVNADKQKVAFSVREMKKKQERDEISHYMSSSRDADSDSYTLGDMLKNRGKE